jgi:hypothetical protein
VLHRSVILAPTALVVVACSSPAIRSQQEGDAGTDAGADASPCEPRGPETCFNGQDDDCNGVVDCADSACDSTAMCVPGDDSTGILVGQDEACPEGYTEREQLLH